MRFKQFLCEVNVDDRNDPDSASDRAFETSLSAKMIIRDVKHLRHVEVAGSRIYLEFDTRDTGRLQLIEAGTDLWIASFYPTFERTSSPIGALQLHDAIAWINSELEKAIQQREEDEAERAAR